jgi:curved DNA-binding protein CbpA
MNDSSVKSCLACLGEFDFTDCVTLDDEWSVIKKTYFKRILIAHPDKGGDNDTFRKIQTSFEILRDLYENKKVSSFANGSSTAKDSGFIGSSFDDLFSELFKEFGRKTTPSYEFYQEAAEKNVPTYRVELARSARSQCSHTNTASAKKCSAYGAEPTFIAKGEIRFGSMNIESGSYGRWMHLECWRVPGLIWRGLPCSKSTEFTSHNIARALATMNEGIPSPLYQLFSSLLT